MPSMNDQLMDDRDLSRFRTKSCQRYVLGCCEFQIRCQYSHTPKSLRRCPFLLLKKEPLTILRYLPMHCDQLRFNVLPADNGENSNLCLRGSGCPFAHSEEEIVYHPLMYKQKLCPFYHQDESARKKGEARGEHLSIHSVAPCEKYYCPFIHELSEQRHIQTSTYFLAPSFVKRVILHLPMPLSSIPVSMLNTGKLTELKSIPDDLLESLLVTRSTSMKSASGPKLNQLNKNQLRIGSLCLVAIPFNREFNADTSGNYLIEPETETELIVRGGCRQEHQNLMKFSADSDQQSSLHKECLRLVPGDTVEILAQNFMATAQNWDQVYFYGRKTARSTSKCHMSGWFPASILLGIGQHEELNDDPHNQHKSHSCLLATDSSSKSSLSNPLLDMATPDNHQASDENTHISCRSVNDKIPAITMSEMSDAKVSIMRFIPILQHLCSELESCLVIELIQGITSGDAENHGSVLNVEDLKVLESSVNRLQASLNHLASITTDSSSSYPLVIDIIKSLSSNSCDVVKTSSNHRVSAASTHSGCAGGDDDDECNNDENDGRQYRQTWDSNWDTKVVGMENNIPTTAI